MIRQERRIYWFPRFLSYCNLFSSVFKIAIEIASGGKFCELFERQYDI